MSALAVAARVPACMTADELALWQAGNDVASGTKDGRRVYTGRAGSPCDDCTLGYAADMRAIGRCDGTPGGVEEEDDMETPIAIVPERSAGRRPKRDLSVRVEAPCESCTHVRVCALREPLIDFVIRAELPPLAEALELTATVRIECAEFHRGRTPAQVAAQRQTVLLAQAAAREARRTREATA